jgi:hypothetical protein
VVVEAIPPNVKEEESAINRFFDHLDIDSFILRRKLAFTLDFAAIALAASLLVVSYAYYLHAST